jgi:S-adenosylmethionine:tRNA ribosyltransferase-isomerase
MKTSDFDYNLPPERIAQTPIEPRDSSRLLTLNRASGQLAHHTFRDIYDMLHPGDLLVLNQTRVIPARLPARKETGGKAEILLLRRVDELTWECLVGGKGMSPGKFLLLGDSLKATIMEDLGGSRRLVRFAEPIEKHFAADGEMPLPPYIHERLTDPERYQTVFSKTPGSAAAPTAGLHFTAELLQRLQAKGVLIATVTLHVGLDTFAPVTEDDPAEHAIHTEWCELDTATAALINQVKAAGKRVIAVGTTSVRTLESAASQDGVAQPFSGPTNIFILPGYTYKLVDAMITNFHLPKSTLIMLVSAFAGREHILTAYNTAIRENYRFFSFGDAMFLY